MRFAPIAAPAIATWLFAALSVAHGGNALPAPIPSFIDQYCVDCHDRESKKGDFDLTSLESDLSDPRAFQTWLKVHDRISTGEMPPKKEERPEQHDLSAMVEALSNSLLTAEQTELARNGRATQRRLNRYE